MLRRSRERDGLQAPVFLALTTVSEPTSITKVGVLAVSKGERVFAALYCTPGPVPTGGSQTGIFVCNASVVADTSTATIYAYAHLQNGMDVHEWTAPAAEDYGMFYSNSDPGASSHAMAGVLYQID